MGVPDDKNCKFFHSHNVKFQEFSCLQMYFKLRLYCDIRAIFKETSSVTMNIFQKKKNLFKSFVKIELSYAFTINMFSTAESCMEQ